MTFHQRLTESINQKQSPILLGLDPRVELIPDDCFENKDKNNIDNQAQSFFNFGTRLIDALQNEIAAIKPQIAFYEALGIAGLTAYKETIAHARKKNIPVIADIKRGDIGSTSEAYAQAHLGYLDSDNLGPFEADAVTLNPWMGKDSLEPFFKRCESKGKGVYLLLHTSNPGSKDLQELHTKNQTYVYEHLAQLIHEWQNGLGENGRNIGVVIGATFPQQLKDLRNLLPNTPFLIPGYGAQGGNGDDLNFLFENGLGLHLVNASRSICFAYKEFNTSLEEGALKAAQAMKKDLVRNKS